MVEADRREEQVVVGDGGGGRDVRALLFEGG